MIGTLAWKEYREHRSVWVALAAAAVLLGSSLFFFMEPGGALGVGTDKQHVLAVIFCVLAAVYGLVCGAMMLAGEVENGTLSFLDTLPAQRWLLWKTKFAVGIGLVLAHAAVLIALSVWLGVRIWTDGSIYLQFGAWCFLVLFLEFLGYAWGLQLSAVCRHVLTAVAVGAPVGFFISLAWTVALGALFALYPVLALGGELLLFALLLGGSAWVFCRVDQSREGPACGPARLRAREWTWPAVNALRWFVWRQNRVAVLAMILGALVAALLATWTRQATALPLIVGLVGASCGVLVLAPEQTTGTFRFIGDQRIALGIFWASKYLCWMITALLAAASVLLLGLIETAIHGITAPTESPFAVAIWSTGIGVLSFVSLAYGFCIGQFAALVIRKMIVALVLAIVATVVVVAVWVPSLVMGGWHFWQVLVPPLVLLLAGRLSMRAWLGGRLGNSRPAMLLSGLALLAVVWIAASLMFRMWEIRNGEVPFDVEAYLVSLPKPEDNEAGRLIQRAAADIGELQSDARFQGKLQQLGEIQGRIRAEPRPDRIWRKGDADVREWLDELFRRPALGDLERLPELAPGIVVDPRRLQRFADRALLNKIDVLHELLLARAVQVQEQGKDALALDVLLTDLALVRAFAGNTLTSRNPEQTALTGLYRWQKQAGDRRPQELQRALAALDRHEREWPTPADQVKADYVVCREGLGPAGTTVPAATASPRAHRAQLALGCQAPWERERSRRIVNAVYAARLKAAETNFWEKPGAPVAFHSSVSRVDIGTDLALTLMESPAIGELVTLAEDNSLQQGLLLIRLTSVGLALGLYERDHGKPATSLQQVVPKYLPQVPIHPFLGRPLEIADVEAGLSEPPAQPGPPGMSGPPVGMPGLLPPGAPAPQPAPELLPK